MITDDNWKWITFRITGLTKYCWTYKLINNKQKIGWDFFII